MSSKQLPKKWLLLLASFCTTLADGRPHTGGKFFFQHRSGEVASKGVYEHLEDRKRASDIIKEFSLVPSGIEVNNVVAAPSEMIEEVMGFPIGHGDLPSPGTPGKTQPSHKSRHKTRRAYVTLDTEKHHTETSSSEDEDNVNAPPAGATDDGTAPSEGSRSSDSEDEDHHLFQSIQYTFHTSWSHLYHGSPIQLDVPCLAVQRFLGQGEARHSTWIFDSASAMHVTGDSSVFLTPLRPSHILMEGSVPGITKETMIGTAKLRFRQPDGDYSPWIIIEDMHYIPGLKVNILSKNKMLKQICLACRCRRTSIRQHNGAYYTPQNWAIHTHERYLLDTVQVQFERDESPQSDPSITPPQFVSVYANLTPQPNITNRTRSADVKTRPVALPGGQSTAWKAAK